MDTLELEMGGWDAEVRKLARSWELTRQAAAATLAQLGEEFAQDVAMAGILLRDALHIGRRVLICGNGGSAADAQHFAAELVGRYLKERDGFPAMALTTDTSILTAVGNDYGFDAVFSRQVQALGAQADVLVAISTSGASINIIRAVQAARAKGMVVIGLTGRRELAGSDVCVSVPSGDTPRIQEVHGLVIHAWCGMVDEGAKP